jgi:hypothetical protein
MLVSQPAIELVLYISSRDPKGQLRSKKVTVIQIKVEMKFAEATTNI